MQEFGPDSPILLVDHVDYSGPQKWLLWPTLRYRVVSPVVHEHRLNVFQQAVLGLARSGLRESTDIADLLSLQRELVSLVISDLKGYHYLDQHGAVTEPGRAALRDGFLDPTSNVVTHVYQDLVTATLLPIATAAPKWAKAVWRGGRHVRINLRTAGAPLTKQAFVVDTANVAEVDPPEAEQIVEAVARSARARRNGGHAGRRWSAPTPERVVSRVSLIGRGDPTYLPLVLRLDRREDQTVENTSWSVFNTMTGQSSNYLRRLVATRAQLSQPLRQQIEDFVGRRSNALLHEYDQLDIDLRRQFADRLEARFTIRLREHGVLIELLTLLERDVLRTRLHGDHQTEIGAVVHRAWQVHEFVLREMVLSYPVPQEPVDRAQDPLAGFFGQCCTLLGLPFSE